MGLIPESEWRPKPRQRWTGSPYTLQQIATHAGVSVSTIRYYITQGAVPKHFGSRANPIWTEEHLQAVMRIRKAITVENKRVTDHRPKPHCPKVDRRDHRHE